MAVLTRPRPDLETRQSTPRPYSASRFAHALTFCALACYSVLAGLLAFRHEPWFDEAQAWLLARDAPLFELYARWLPLEGSPGLWHTILAVPAKAGMPYAAISVISATLGGLAAFLILRRSPYPLPAKLLLPFSFFLLYQYAVVARSYSLLAPLLFGLAIAHPGKQDKVAPYLVLLALLANTSAHGFLIAAVLTALHVVDLIRARQSIGKQAAIRHLLGLTTLGGVLGLVALLLRQSQSSGFIDKDFKFNLESFETVTTGVLKASLASRGWATALVLAISLLWFWRRKTLLLYLLPTSAVLVFFSIVYISAWHEGIILLVWLFAMWVSFGRNGPESEAHLIGGARPQKRMLSGDTLLRYLAAGTLLFVGLVHVKWSLTASRYDLERPYSGSRAAAAFIKKEGYGDKKVFGTGSGSLAVLPYFRENIYTNIDGGRGPAFWVWSLPRPMIEDPSRIVSMKPDLIVLSVKSIEGETQPQRYPGYRAIGCFPGALVWKYGPIEPDAFILLAREGVPVGATSFPKDPTQAIGCGTVRPPV